MTVGLVFNTRPLRAGPVFFKSLLYSKGLAHSRSSVNSMGRKKRKKKGREGRKDRGREGGREKGGWMHGMKRLISLAMNVLPEVESHNFQCIISRG